MQVKCTQLGKFIENARGGDRMCKARSEEIEETTGKGHC